MEPTEPELPDLESLRRTFVSAVACPMPVWESEDGVSCEYFDGLDFPAARMRYLIWGGAELLG